MVLGFSLALVTICATALSTVSFSCCLVCASASLYNSRRNAPAWIFWNSSLSSRSFSIVNLSEPLRLTLERVLLVRATAKRVPEPIMLKRVLDPKLLPEPIRFLAALLDAFMASKRFDNRTLCLILRALSAFISDN